jgi:hypothetical protein
MRLQYIHGISGKLKLQKCLLQENTKINLDHQSIMDLPDPLDNRHRRISDCQFKICKSPKAASHNLHQPKTVQYAQMTPGFRVATNKIIIRRANSPSFVSEFVLQASEHFRRLFNRMASEEKGQQTNRDPSNLI